MKIYIKNTNTNQWVLQKAEILPTNVPTKDETLETFSFALISSDVALPYAPMQKVKVDFAGDGSEIVYFYIVSDNVETYCLNPLKYKHSISCIQNTRYLSKHLVRNSSFTQPAYLQKSILNSQSGCPYYNSSDAPEIQWEVFTPSLNYGSEKMKITPKEKIKSAKLKISFQYVIKGQYVVVEEDPSLNHYNEEGTLYSQDEYIGAIIEHDGQVDDIHIDLNDLFTLRYKLNGQTYTEDITPEGLDVVRFEINRAYMFNRIKELSESGNLTEVEILFKRDNFLRGEYISNYDPTKLPWFCSYMIQVELIVETYYYNCYDILNLLIQRQRKITDLSSKEPLFVIPEDTNQYTENQRELARLLRNTIAPNFTFTQLTMYECVAEVFRLFDAIFTMDENNVLGIEYFNDLSTADPVSSNAKFTGRTLAISEDKYTNGLVANYQDARVEEKFPKKDGVFAYLRSAEFGVPEDQDHNFIVPHNIQSIIKCEIFLDDVYCQNRLAGSSAVHVTASDFGLDITRYVVNASVWSELDAGTLSDSDYNNRIVKQHNSVYFDEGDNKIKCAYSFKDSWGHKNYSLYYAVRSAYYRITGVEASGHGDNWFGPDEYYKDKWNKIRMRLTYIASVDGKTQVHSLTNKYDGETLIDQTNGAVDLNKMGLNMLGLSLKLGNPTLNATHKITRWADRIKTGQLYEYTAKDPNTGQNKTSLWIANVVNYTFFGGFIQAKISFVQNFNQLALRTQLLREKRMSNISKELTQKSEDIITDYVYISSAPFSSSYGEEINFRASRFHSFMENSFGVGGPFVKLPDFYLFDIRRVYQGQVYGVYIPTVRYGAGNTVNFEMSFEHPMNAGNQTKSETGWFGSQSYLTSHVIYTDTSDGEMVVYSSSKFSEGFLDTISIKCPENTRDYTHEFPIVTIYSHSASSDSKNGYINIINYKPYKQPNEIFALNYQLAFLPLPGRENIDFIGSEFINNNCFVKDFEERNRRLYIVFKNEKSSNLDLKAFEYTLKREIEMVSEGGDVNNYRHIWFKFEATTSSGQCVSWAIVDENDNVLFATNSNISWESGFEELYLYYATRRSRLI